MELGRMEHDIEDFYGPSGESFSDTRRRSSETPRKTAHYDVSKYEEPLNIDIYNFEDAQFADSKYILTSPKSLEACCRLTLKPVELLRKPLEDFQKELNDSDVSAQEIYECYSKRELERQENIQMVQCMRQSIILEDSRQQLPHTAPAKMAPASSQHNSDSSPHQPIRSTPTGGASRQSSSGSIGSIGASDEMTVGFEKGRHHFTSSRVPVPSKTHRKTSQKMMHIPSKVPMVGQCGRIPSHSVHPTWNGHIRPLTPPNVGSDVGPIHNTYLPPSRTPKLLAPKSPNIGGIDRCASKSHSDSNNAQPKLDHCGRIPSHSVHPTWNGHIRPLTPPIAYTAVGPIHNTYLPPNRTPKLLAGTPRSPSIGRVTTPRSPSVGRVTTPRSPCVGRVTTPRSPSVGRVTTPRSPSIGRVSRRDTVSQRTPHRAPSDTSTRRSKSTECYSGRPAWNGYVRQRSPAPAYSKVGPIHTEYIPGWYLPSDPRRSQSSGRTSRCDTASLHDTPVNGNIDYSDNIPSLKCRRDTSGSKLVSQSEYTRKLAPGCQRNESSDIPAPKTDEANQDVCNEQGKPMMRERSTYSNRALGDDDASVERTCMNTETEVKSQPLKVSNSRSRLDKFTKKQKNGQADSNYQSYTDVSSIASYSSSRRPSSVKLCDAKPITNPELRRHLHLTSANSPRIKPQRSATFAGRHSTPSLRPADQKILELMLAKREEQVMEQERKDQAHRRWDAERERSASAGAMRGKDRRSMMSGDRKLLREHNGTPTGRQRPTSIDHRHNRTDSGMSDTSRSKHVSAASSNTSSACSCAENGADWTCAKCNNSVRKHLAKMRQVFEEKKQRDLDKKKKQEERLEQHKRNQDEYVRLLRQEQSQELRRAESFKDVRAQEQQLKTKFRNFVTKKRQEEAIGRKQQQEIEEKKLMQVAMTERLELAERKRHTIKQQRVKGFQNNSSDLHDRLDRTKQKKEKLEMEMEIYRSELQTYLQMQEKRAEEVARETVLKKKMKAQEGVIEKNALQRSNLEKLIEQEEEWKAEVEADIAMKQSRIKILQMEKEDRIAQSRDLANTSRQLREHLRSHFSMNDLDQVNNHMHIETRIRSPCGGVNSKFGNLTINDK